jgi:hypothetical protein
MATGDQSGTWGDTTNTNLGTLLEQAITGYVAIAKVGTGDYTLSNTDYAANENRNALIEFTGTPGGAFNVVVPLAEKLWVFKNSTDGAMTVKGATGTTTTVAVGASAWLFCDGTDVRDALGYYFGSTVTALSPATNNTQALGTTALQWADLFLASGGVINFDNGDVTITEGTNTLAFAGASSGYSYDAALLPSTNDAAALGVSGTAWADLFLASGGVINFNAGNYTLTHSAGVLTANGALSIGTGNALTAGTIELGAATDTTLSRGAAGFIAVEGNRVPSPASQASGDILYRGTTEWERLAKGTASQVLTMNSGATAPEWATAASGFTAASQAEQEAASSTTVGVTPGRQQFHPSAAKCWAYVTYAAGVPTLASSYNITSVTDSGVGHLTITIATDFSSSSWSPSVSYAGGLIGGQLQVTSPGEIQYGSIAAGSIAIGIHEPSTGSAGDPVDANSISFQGYGDQ